MPPENKAAYLQAQCKPLEVRPAPYTQPDQGQVVVKSRAVAINPVNWIKQHAGQGYAPWIQLPFVMGSDVAGEVVEVGPGVERVRVGDRVLGHAMCMNSRINRSCEGAFQQYTVLRSNLISPIPNDMSYSNACVLPLGLSTAARGLFAKDYLSLSLPPTTSPSIPSTRSTRRILLVWGGSTSVGCNAIQLAHAAGYEVITTASPNNHAFLQSLGATHTFDYRSPTTITDISTILQEPNTVSVGALAIGLGSLTACTDILGSLPSSNHSRKNSSDTDITTSTTSSYADPPRNTADPSPVQHAKFIAQVTLDTLPAASVPRKPSHPIDWNSLPGTGPRRRCKGQGICRVEGREDEIRDCE